VILLPRWAGRPIPPKSSGGKIIYFAGAIPRIIIGLEVVGIAASRSQGIGIPDAEVTT